MAGEKDFDDSTGKLKGMSSESESEDKTDDDSVAPTKTTAFTTASSKAKESSSAVPLLLTSEWTSYLLHWLTSTTSSPPGTVAVKATPPVYTISNIEQKALHRSPPVALITSSLQQEASRKLGFSPQQTMVSKLVSHNINITRTFT